MEKRTSEALNRTAERIAKAAIKYCKENGITWKESKAKGWGCVGGDAERINAMIERGMI